MSAALAVRVGALIPRLQGLATSAAPTIAATSARLRAMGMQVGSKVDDIIAWVKTNPVNATLTALTMGSLGVSVVDLFDTEEGKKVATDVTLGRKSLADYSKIDAAGAISEKLDLQVAEVGPDLYTAREVLRFAKGHYGSIASAITAHRLHQAFFEMPLNDVETGYENLRT